MKINVQIQQRKGACMWIRFHDEWDYETDCKHYFEILEGATLAEIGFIFCPFCGRKIKEKQLINSLDVT
ncbi:MAG: hypothetical protein ACXW1W_02765 [Methylococcaceae bacterium]